MITSGRKRFCRSGWHGLLLACCCGPGWTAELPVVPGLAGYGVDTPAGRGGAIYRVTHLDTWGEGSLAYFLTEKSGPRTIVFEVSGTIWQADDIVIENPYVTVAFQTAPSPGITVAGAGIEIRTHDVLLQHARVRVGDRPGDPYPGDRDGIMVKRGSYNVVIDHCSVSWAVDENASVSGPQQSAEYDNIRDVSFSNCIFGEALDDSIHPEGPHSKGMLVGDYSENVSVIRNIFAHAVSRGPSLKAATSSYVANNLVYNPYDWATGFSEADVSTGRILASVVGNAYLSGPDSIPEVAAIKVFSSVSPDSQIYLHDNLSSWQDDPQYRAWLSEHSPLTPEQGPWSLAYLKTGFIPEAAAPPMQLDGFVPRPASAIADELLLFAGARASDRDAVDARLVEDIRNRSGSIIDSQEQVGGWPQLAENRRAAQIPGDPQGDADRDGYSNLEEWLHTMALLVEGRGARYEAASGELHLAAVDVPGEGAYQARLARVDAAQWLFALREATPVQGQVTAVAEYQAATGLLSIPDLVAGVERYRVKLQRQPGDGSLRFRLLAAERL